MTHPVYCVCLSCLADIEAQYDGTEPYYVKHLIAGLREAAKREQGWQRMVDAMARPSLGKVG